MSGQPDVIVVGSGPAGVSACFPLLDASLGVLMLDGGATPDLEPPEEAFLDWRSNRGDQWRWMLGADFVALRDRGAVSPKLRVPGHRYVFEGFGEANRIVANGVAAVGSMATGGLSQSWGCGIAALSEDELSAFPCPKHRIRDAYCVVSRRIGLSGATDDDLSSYFGVDAWAAPPIPADELHSEMLDRYTAQRNLHHSHGFRMGRSRVAVLSRDQGTRRACSATGNCLYGCRNRSLYAATEDLHALRRRAGFRHEKGHVVAIGVGKDGDPWVEVAAQGGRERLRARKVVLAAGALTTTRLALSALSIAGEVRLESSPTAAFLLWRPQHLGRRPGNGFGLGQLSFVQQSGSCRAFGSLFSPTGIPLSEFVVRLPFGRRSGIDIMRSIMSSCLVGNLFLPGSMSELRLAVSSDGDLLVRGAHGAAVKAVMRELEADLRRAFRRTGWFLVPRSFTLGVPGGDLHYGASLPMRASPRRGETDAAGTINGLPNIHVADGASLPEISEKPHTLTIMANAHRIGEEIAAELTLDPRRSLNKE